MKIPFTDYDVKISKRGIKILNDGVLVDFVDWARDKTFVKSTPILEQIYKVHADEFAKIDLHHVISNKNRYEVMEDDLNYCVSLRPNELQSKFDFLYTAMYQRLKYGNFIAFLERDKNGNVVRIHPQNAFDYEMGNGYQVGDDEIWIKLKNKKDNSIELVEYSNILHLRLNPNDIFSGDRCSILNNGKVIVDIVDASLSSLLSELKESGTIYGVIHMGRAGAGISAALGSNESKEAKQEEIRQRVRKAKGGVLVLDAGEEWTSLSSPFKTVSASEIDEYIKYLYQFYGTNKKVADGTASFQEMEVFFNKSIMPPIEQLIEEMNFKIFTKEQRKAGHAIEYYRNPFEYLPIDKAIDVAYKGAMDIMTNERRKMIYHLPPVEGGDILMSNKNFEKVMKGAKNEDTEGS